MLCAVFFSILNRHDRLIFAKRLNNFFERASSCTIERGAGEKFWKMAGATHMGQKSASVLDVNDYRQSVHFHSGRKELSEMLRLKDHRRMNQSAIQYHVAPRSDASQVSLFYVGMPNISSLGSIETESNWELSKRKQSL